MNARRVLGLAGGVAIVGGAGLVAWGGTLPIVRDTPAAADLYTRWCNNAGVQDRAIGARYDALFTARYSLLDSGMALISGGLTLVVLVAVARNEAGSIRSPSHRWTFIAVGLGCLALLFSGTAVGLYDDATRMRFPSCADSIAIPLAGMAFAGPMVAVICAVLGWLVSRRFATLPVLLFAWNGDHPIRSWTLLAFWGALGILVALATISAGVSADRWAVPGGVVALYLLASTRAALTFRSVPALAQGGVST